jgi:site-specific DNA-methyltransferase (adenine-specific)
MISEVENIDCMIGMAKYPDKFFDLSIVDPPYGGGQHFNFRYGVGKDVYENCKPEAVYWKELFRVSKNQIVWGANYFTDNLPENRCWISWYKGNPIDSFSDFELAWTSFDQTSRSIRLESYGFNHADKRHSGNGTIHPTQKPISLYSKLLTDYAKSGDKILDTHMGSQSSRIAAYKLGFDYYGFEIDKTYFEDGNRRFENSIIQQTLFK